VEKFHSWGSQNWERRKENFVAIWGEGLQKRGFLLKDPPPREKKFFAGGGFFKKMERAENFLLSTGESIMRFKSTQQCW